MNSEKCKSLQEEVKEYAADDMDVSDVESAYDFESGGPEQFDDSTTDISDSYGMDIDSIMQMFGGEMSAAEYDDVDSDMNQDLDGKEKYSGEMGAYNFNSDGSMDGETYEEVDEEDVLVKHTKKLMRKMCVKDVVKHTKKLMRKMCVKDVVRHMKMLTKT
jgi:hypothetical protein